MNIQLARGDQYIYNDVDGEIVMMNTTTGMYVSLNETAKQIWNLLEQPQPLSAIIDALSVEYNVTREQCENDVIPFIELLLERNIAVTS